MQRLIGRRSPLDQTADVVRFVVASAIACAVAGTIGPTTICTGNADLWKQYPTLWLTWWQGDLAGILILTPLILAWSKPPRRPMTPVQAAELSVAIVITMGLTQMLFAGWFDPHKVTSQIYLVVPFLLWIVFRFGQREAVTAVTLVTALAVRGTTLGFGPFARESLNESLLLLQAFISVITVTMMMLAAACYERDHALRELESRVEREGVLNRINQVLRNSFDPREIESMAILVLGEALKADRCFSIFFDSASNEALIEQDWRRGDLPSLTGIYRAADFGEMNDEGLYDAGAPLVVEDVRAGPWNARTAEILTGLRMTAVIRVPLFDEGELVATVGVAMADEPRVWTEEETMLVEAVATQIRGAVEAAAVHQKEHNISTTLQKALQPTDMKVPGLHIGYFYKPALDEASVGGDFCDAFFIDQNAYALVIGDVSGKGLAAAVQVATIRNMLRCVLYLGGTITDAITELNDILNEHDLLTGFVTLFVGVFNPETLELAYISCGQEPGLLYRGDSGKVDELSSTGPPLGVTEEIVYTSERIFLSPGDSLILYTDGISEAGLSRRELLGAGGLSDILCRYAPQGNDADSLISLMMSEVEAWFPETLHDDACLLAVRVRQTAPQKAAVLAPRKKPPVFQDEKRRLSMHREVLAAVTGGRLLLCSEKKLQKMVPAEIPLTVTLNEPRDATLLRHRLRELSIPPGREDDLLTSATEAAANAIRHGGGGVAQAWTSRGGISLLITDNGRGICPTDMARAILELGWSSTNSLGMGFTMMLAAADSLIVSTSRTGTSILLHISNSPQPAEAGPFPFHTAK
jgi:serine phosphatase RsbU (regulator of sigma subunit)/anti-sigma regulatory factor (Ser/Thr protein kinase)